MKKTYESPVLTVLSLQSAEVVTASIEESNDITVSFDSLWSM